MSHPIGSAARSSDFDTDYGEWVGYHREAWVGHIEGGTHVLSACMHACSDSAPVPMAACRDRAHVCVDGGRDRAKCKSAWGGSAACTTAAAT
eukprot:360723-Chlamydomonas_euryale.AAC.7